MEEKHIPKGFKLKWTLNLDVSEYDNVRPKAPDKFSEILFIYLDMSSPPFFNAIRVTRSLALCVCFVDRCLSFCSFTFGHCVVCPFSIFGF